MTLVVARIINDAICIFSDTRVTEPSLAKRSPLRGALKILIVEPQIAVAYAGVVSLAEEAFKRIVALQRPTRRRRRKLNAIFRLLLDIHREAPEHIEFGVASLLDTRSPRLFKISGLQIHADQSHFWLGSAAAFARFQERFHCPEIESASAEHMKVVREGPEPERAEYKKVAFQMKAAFEDTVQSSDSDDVGDFVIAAQVHPSLTPRMFVYQFGISTFNPEEISVSESWDTMPLGTCEGGAFAVAHLRTLNETRHGVAMHFSPGNFGLLFCPQIEFEPILVPSVDGEAFVRELEQRYGLTIEGCVRVGNTLKIMTRAPAGVRIKP